MIPGYYIPLILETENRNKKVDYK